MYSSGYADTLYLSYEVWQLSSRHSGEIMGWLKIKMTSKVPTKPFIYQICKLQVGSYSYDMSKMAFDQTDKVQG